MKKINMGIFGIIGILILVVLASGCTSNSNSTTSNNSQSSQPSQSNSQPATPSSSFQPVTLSGTGDKATQSFNWPGGLMRIEMTHTGSSNFIIHLVDSSTGSTVEYVENEIGSINGSRAFSVPAGSYIFDVQADGKWTIKVTK